MVGRAYGTSMPSHDSLLRGMPSMSPSRTRLEIRDPLAQGIAGDQGLHRPRKSDVNAIPMLESSGVWLA